MRGPATTLDGQHEKEQEMTTNRNESFTGKVAFVTGAANGIGRAAALAFGNAHA